MRQKTNVPPIIDYPFRVYNVLSIPLKSVGALAGDDHGLIS